MSSGEYVDSRYDPRQNWEQRALEHDPTGGLPFDVRRFLEALQTAAILSGPRGRVPSRLAVPLLVLMVGGVVTGMAAHYTPTVEGAAPDHETTILSQHPDRQVTISRADIGSGKSPSLMSPHMASALVDSMGGIGKTAERLQQLGPVKLPVKPEPEIVRQPILSLPKELKAAPPKAPSETPPARPPGEEPINFTVRYGDTLYSIASRYGLTVGELAQANGIANPNLIYAGQTLTIPQRGEGGGQAQTVTPVVCTSNIECSEDESCFTGVCTKGEKTLASECAEGENLYAGVCVKVGEAVSPEVTSPDYPPLDEKIKIIWGEEGTALLNSAQKQQYESLIREAIKGLTEYLGEGFVEGEMTIQVPADQPRLAGANRTLYFQRGDEETESPNRVGHELIHGLTGILPTPGLEEGLATYLQSVAFDSQGRVYDDLKYYQEVYHLALRQGVKFSAEYFYIPQSGDYDYYGYSLAAFADLEDEHPGFVRQLAWRLRDFQGETLSLDQTKAIVEEVWPGGWEEVGKHQILLWSGVPVL